MQSLLESVGLGSLVPNRVNVPAAPALNLRNINARRRLNVGAQHPPGNEPAEIIEENIAIANNVPTMNDMGSNMSPPGNSPTVGGRRRKASRKSRKASRKSRKASRKSRKASRKSRKASRKSRRN